jgi:quercetin dioxygenase-like cupin family protein
MRTTHTRIYTDGDGETHFGEFVVDLAMADFAPPAPPMHLSDGRPASGLRFIGAPAGWDSEPHPAPRCQYIVMLSGTCEAGTSDGDVRRFQPGQVVLLEDTHGKGHRTRIVGDEDWLAAVITVD